MSTFSIKRLLLAFILLLYSLISRAQTDFLAEPTIGINHKVDGFYSVNFQAASRQIIVSNEEFQFNFKQVQVAHFSTLRIGYADNISLGLMYRNREWFENSSNEIRITQQYNTTTFLRLLRLNHRFRVEQRLYDNLTIHRFRYRAKLNRPLRGEVLDEGETFIAMSLESLLSVNKISDPELDLRLTTQIGWNISPNKKLKLGLQYRIEAFNKNIEHVLFVLPSLSIKI